MKSKHTFIIENEADEIRYNAMLKAEDLVDVLYKHAECLHSIARGKRTIPGVDNSFAEDVCGILRAQLQTDLDYHGVVLDKLMQ
jgi:hypothetical protein